MFTSRVAPPEYSDPWTASYAQRLKSLKQGSPRVAYFYEFPDNSTFRYRIYNMIQALHDGGSKASGAYFCNSDIKGEGGSSATVHMDEIIDQADVLVLCRVRYDDKIGNLIARAKNRGRRVFFDVDDLIFDTTYTHFILNALAQDMNDSGIWDTWFAAISRVGETLRQCDGAITTNDYLAQKIENFSGIPADVIPNFINREQMGISELIYQAKVRSDFSRDGQLHLGYFSGTPTHQKDFALMAGALVEILERHPYVVLMVVGSLEKQPELKRFGTRVQCLPLQNFLELQHTIGHIEVNLVPLQNSVFTHCKSELKYFEAAIVGTVTIASPVHTYGAAIRDGVNGHLAKSYEWLEKIESVIDTLEGYPEVATQAFEHAKAAYGWTQQRQRIEQILFD